MGQGCALEQYRAHACGAQLRQHRDELGVPDAVHGDRVTFGSLKRTDELCRPRLEPAGGSKRPTQQQQDSMS